jgi:hypothetical protein
VTAGLCFRWCPAAKDSVNRDCGVDPTLPKFYCQSLVLDSDSSQSFYLQLGNLIEASRVLQANAAVSV